jgi:hypothetical protein
MWKNGVSISESVLVLGGLVISTKENFVWWKIWPRRERVVENELYIGVCTSFMYL